MKSRAVAVLASIAFAAAPLAAQAPTQDTFQFENIHAGAPAIDGAYIGPYIGAFDTAPNVWGTPFDVWCVDYAHHINFGDVYNVWITPMDGADYSHTRLGAADKPEYEWTAYFAGLMDWDQPGHSADGARDAGLQDIMWVLMGGNTSNLQSSGLTRSQYLAAFRTSSTGTTLGLNSLATDWYDHTPLNNFAVYTDWSIITCDPGSGNAVSSCPFQEFIFRDGSGVPQDVVPEPATLTLLGTGLATVIGARRKRRNRKA